MYAVLGSPYYVAPEVLRARPPKVRASCALCCECQACGACPWSAGSSATLPFYSRPGSAYVRSEGPSGAYSGSADGRHLLQVLEDDGGGIDPLEHDNDDGRVVELGASIGTLWREGF